MKKIEKNIVNFLRDYFLESGKSKAIIGLSGGIDSALSAVLAKEAIGKENLQLYYLPYETSSQESFKCAKIMSEFLDCDLEIRDITKPAKAFFDLNNIESNQQKGNVMARCRMIVLFDQAQSSSGLVIGTSNKTERLLGYGTLYGDTACSINPIGDLYKTEVWELSRHLNIPEQIIDRTPTADLWAGQTDEKEFGFSYSDADKILKALYEDNASEDILYKKFCKETVEAIQNRVKLNSFKLSSPPIYKNH